MKIWKIKTADESFARRLAAELKLHPVLARVLGGYGFADVETVARFLNPRLKDVSDPFLIPQMDAAVLRIWRAIEQQQAILVYGDYDADGIVSAALLSRVFGRLGCQKVTVCLPDRQEDGYGFSVATIEKSIATSKPDLIITVDCGITAVAAAAFVRQAGVDLIITDHHELGTSLPEAQAIVNPKLGDSEPLKMLAGVGVAFKMCHALLKHGRMHGKAAANDIDLKDYLDLVALGTVADIVPLLHENRTMVRHGLERINAIRSPAWSAIKEAASLQGRLDAYHLAYCIAPRLNAAGRLGSAGTALDLFMTDDLSRARTIAGKLDDANRARQKIEKQILLEAVAEIDRWFDSAVDYGIVVGRRSWHIGVIGIVASRLAAKYNRPVIVIGFDEDGAGRGSARSIAGFNILKGLEKCREHLQSWGGHEMAAGMDVEEGKISGLKAAFNMAARDELKGKDMRKALLVNSWVMPGEISEDACAALESLAPFGQDNPRPVFAARGLRIASLPRVVGQKHLRFKVSDGKSTIDAVAFNHAESAAPLSAAQIPEGPVDVAFQFRKNTFNGFTNMELNVLDCKTATGDGSNRLFCLD